MNILSIDFGTSSVKTSVLDESYRVLGFSKADYDFRVLDMDRVELDLDLLVKASLECMERLDEYRSSIEAVGYCTFSPSLVVMDNKGNGLYPVITHLDRRSRKQSAHIVKVMGKSIYQNITGVLPFAGGVSLTSLLWMKENEPDRFGKTFKIGHLNTYVYRMLTGQWATDPTNASMMGLYETVSSKGWSSEICKAFDIPEGILPPIHAAGTALAGLSREAARAFGLKEGIPVVLGSNDAATAQIGADNTSSGDMLNIAGSSEMISIITDTPRINDQYYLRNAITPGKWQVYATTIGGFAIEWFRKEFYRDMEKDAFFSEELPRVIETRLGASSVRFLPYLAGDRHSLRKKRGGFTGLTLESSRDDLLAAILLGIQEPIAKTISLAEDFVDLKDTLKVTGGMTTDVYISLKRKVFSDFRLETIDNCPTLGNAKLALQATASGWA